MPTRPEQRAPFDVFQEGLIRGAARLSFAPHKRYFYVEHPVEGWRVYLRAGTFIHELGQPFDAARFLVVKTTEADPRGKSWEPPKGQMEGKDTDSTKDIYSNLVENVYREVLEEAKISNLRSLHHTGIVYQNREKDYPPNTYFQYHIFQAYVTPAEIEKAQEVFAWIHEHPLAFARFKKDRREKDALAWYGPHTRMMGRWSPSIVKMYLERYAK
jgi:ADP-ribose pyrophosphatase YjhB (NUDIX family)